jgi:hypothetical protein
MEKTEMGLGFVSCGQEWFLFLRFAHCTVGLSLMVDVLRIESQPNWVREKATQAYSVAWCTPYTTGHPIFWLGVFFSPAQFSLQPGEHSAQWTKPVLVTRLNFVKFFFVFSILSNKEVSNQLKISNVLGIRND